MPPIVPGPAAGPAAATTAREAFISMDELGRVVAFNPAAERLFGYPAAEIMGHDLAELMPERYRERHRRGLRSYLDTRKRHLRWEGVELVGQARNGEEIPILVSFSEATTGGERIFTAIVRDLRPERRQAELLAQRLGLIELAHDAMIVREVQGTIRFWSRGAETLYGWSAGEALGRDLHALLATTRPRPAPETDAELESRGYWEGELTQATRSGTRIHVASRQALFRDSAQGALRVFEVHRDITLQHEAELEAARARERLQDLNHALEIRNREVERLLAANDRLLATIGHELRTPLNTMLGFAELLQEQPGATEAERQRAWLSHIRASGRQLSSLLDELLDFVRIRAGRVELHLQPLDLGREMQAVLPGLELAARAKGVILDELPATPFRVYADSQRLRQVLENLMGNAIKFTPTGGRAWFEVRALPAAATTQAASARLEITVADTGIGIPEAEQEAIFEDFYRVPSATGRGAGLGLAIVRRLVVAQGGAIAVTSAPGRGSRFTVTLPAAA